MGGDIGRCRYIHMDCIYMYTCRPMHAFTHTLIHGIRWEIERTKCLYSLMEFKQLMCEKGIGETYILGQVCMLRKRTGLHISQLVSICFLSPPPPPIQSWVLWGYGVVHAKVRNMFLFICIYSQKVFWGGEGTLCLKLILLWRKQTPHFLKWFHSPHSFSSLLSLGVKVTYKFNK